MNLVEHLDDLSGDLKSFREGKIDRLFLRETCRATHVLVRGKAILCMEAQLRANGVKLLGGGEGIPESITAIDQ